MSTQLLLHESFTEFSSPTVPNNYLKKAIWNLKGDTIITVSEDKVIRIFTLPADTFNKIWHNLDSAEFKPCPFTGAQAIKEQNHVYDLAA